MDWTLIPQNPYVEALTGSVVILEKWPWTQVDLDVVKSVGLHDETHALVRRDTRVCSPCEHKPRKGHVRTVSHLQTKEVPRNTHPACSLALPFQAPEP
jgi:hypothetical protein